MKRIILLLVALIGVSMADTLTVEPVVKSELVFVQEIDSEAPAGSLLLGEQDFGVEITKGKTSVVGVANFSGDVGNIEAGLSKALVTQKVNDAVSISAGYGTIPFGFWSSNSVNYPLARTGGWSGSYDAIKTKALQTAVNYEKGLLKTEVAGYQGASGSFKSVAGRVTADLALLAPEISFKSEDFESNSLSIGLTLDLGKIGVNTAYFTGLGDVDNAGTYLEVSVFPTEALIIAIRGETLNTKDFTDGETQFSLSTLYLLNEHVYFGMEYNAWMVYSLFDEPLHTMTGLIGCEF